MSITRPPPFPKNVLINGHGFDFSSIKLKCLGTPNVEFERFVEISYQHALEISPLRGDVGQLPLDEGFGEYTASASITLYLSDWRELRAMLAAQPGGGGWMQKMFNISVAYAEGEEQPTEDKLLNCRVIRVNRGYRRSGDALMVSVEIYVREIQEDGLKAVDNGYGGGLLPANFLG